MSEQDYYKTLGVSRQASADEIRKAYKKLVRQYHPDSNPGDESAAEKFKQIQEAYEVLGDPEKREEYDRYGAAFRGGPGRGGPYQQTYTWTSGEGGPIDLEQIFGNFGDLFGQTGGRAGRGFRGGGRTAATPRKGQDIRLEIEVPFQVAAEGGQHAVTFPRDGKTERINVKIPAGVDNGSVIRLAGEGHPGLHGGPPGDLKLVVRVAPHPWFRREGDNILVEVPVTPAEAALGAKVEVPTLSEGRGKVTIPAGTSSGTKIRLRNKGIKNARTGERGDELVVVKIVVPPELSPAAKTLYEQLAETETYNPREGLW